VVWDGVTVWRDRRHLVFETQPLPQPHGVPVDLGQTETPVGTLVVEESAAPEHFDPSPLVEYLDPAKLQFPLTLRPWEKGDAFTPYGMPGRKNVSDLLTERKVPPQERARQLVLLSGGEIVWVVGHRLAEEASLRASADRAVRLEWNPGEALVPDGDAR
jgi:tRNA(Ile)-lysidine synthetase-like protein